MCILYLGTDSGWVVAGQEINNGRVTKKVYVLFFHPHPEGRSGRCQWLVEIAQLRKPGETGNIKI